MLAVLAIGCGSAERPAFLAGDAPDGSPAGAAMALGAGGAPAVAVGTGGSATASAGGRAASTGGAPTTRVDGDAGGERACTSDADCRDTEFCVRSVVKDLGDQGPRVYGPMRCMPTCDAGTVAGQENGCGAIEGSYCFAVTATHNLIGQCNAPLSAAHVCAVVTIATSSDLGC